MKLPALRAALLTAGVLLLVLPGAHQPAFAQAPPTADVLGMHNLTASPADRRSIRKAVWDAPSATLPTAASAESLRSGTRNSR